MSDIHAGLFNRGEITMRYQFVLLLFSFIFAQSLAHAGDHELSGKWMGKSDFYYLDFLPGNKCSQRKGASIQNYSCRVTGNKIMFGPFVATYKLEGDILTITYPDKRVYKYTKFSVWAKGKPDKAFLEAIHQGDINGAKSFLKQMKQVRKFHCEKLYEHAYKTKNIEFGKFGSKNGCTHDLQLGALKRLFGNYSMQGLDYHLDLTKQFAFIVENKITDVHPEDLIQILPRTGPPKPHLKAKVKEHVLKKNKIIERVRNMLEEQIKTAPKREKKTVVTSNKIEKRPQSSTTPTQTARTVTHKSAKQKQNKLPFRTPPAPIQGGCKSVTPTPPSGLTNLAIKGKASQVSTGTWVGIKAVASLAIDGNTDGAYRNNSVSHTNSHIKPWWIVDLGASKSIKHIAIWNRTDRAATARLKNVSVYVLDSSGEIVFQQGYCPKRQYPKPALMIDLPSNTKGQYVKIMLNKPGYLQLAEVQVYGE